MTAATCSALPATEAADGMLTALRRGVLAGAVGGLLAGLFGFLLAEPVMDRAVRLESARLMAAGDHTAVLFDRHTQHVGFVVATLLTGVALGVLYGVVAGLLTRGHAGPPPGESWRRACQLGGAAFFALTLVPFLRYPANPPGVGDSGTIEQRSRLYLLSIVVGLVGAFTASLLARNLAGRSSATRQLAVSGVLVATVALTFVLPADTDPLTVPAGLLWTFRLLSLGTLMLLWAGLSATYGLLAERAVAQAVEKQTSVADRVKPSRS